MGIKNLTKLIADYAPDAMKEIKDESLLGRVIAIDASLWLYQFLVSIRYGSDMYLQTDDGETTSHIRGFLSRTTSLLEKGIKPVFVFDGKPPEMKNAELERRKASREKAEKELEEAKEAGDAEKVSKLSKRTVRATPEHMEDIRQLLALLGIPFVDAACEAEAQCAELTKAGKVYATATEDMDSLTFGTTRLLRNLFSNPMKKRETMLIDLGKTLTELELTMAQFIDLCILCGCDYLPTVRGIGPIKALQMVKKHKTIEEIVKNLDASKFKVPEGFVEQLPTVRKLFTEHEVVPTADISFKWKSPNEEGLLKFLVQERQFGEENVKRSLERIRKSKAKRSQKRLDSFFAVVPSPLGDSGSSKKRKKEISPKKGKQVKR